jgi:hypothetical protein
MKVREGERISAIVEEVLSRQDLIVGYDGALLRVMNTSNRMFKIGDKLDLVVVRTEPLELQFFDSYRRQFVRYA